MNTQGATAFDDTLRQHHAAALASLSPQVQAQLAQRRVAALRGTPAARSSHHWMRYAMAGSAAVLALGIGLQFALQPPSNPVAVPTTALAAHTTATVQAATILDEDPEFYAWLASPDVEFVAKE